MKIHTQLTFLHCLAVSLALGIDDDQDTKLSNVGESLVRVFQSYLLKMQQKKVDELVRKGKDINSIDLQSLSICRSKLDCGLVIQNFGFYLDSKSRLHMCRRGAGRKLDQHQELDVSPYCHYLQYHFDICRDKSTTKTMGCKYSCKKRRLCDSDECMCHRDATGRYINGRYECSCKAGYHGDGYVCTDIDECAEKEMNNCHQSALCKNVPGSFICVCEDGFSADRGACKDHKERISDLRTDDEYGEEPPVYTTDPPTGTCKTGYYEDETHCIDIDECEEETNRCNDNAVCNNTIGSYTCKCTDGFTGDGIYCADIDECENFQRRCHPFWATCDNTFGSFTCKCKDGFEGNGVSCKDISECKKGHHSCSKFAECSDIPGSYECSCLYGFYGNGKMCTGNRGHEFYLLFLPQNRRDRSDLSIGGNASILAVADENGSFTVSYASGGNNKTDRNEISKRIQRGRLKYELSDDVIEGVRIQSKKVISLYGLTENFMRSSSFTVIPSHRLSVRYLIPSVAPYKKLMTSENTNQIAVIASKNKTDVMFHLKMTNGSIKYKGKEFAVGDVMKISLKELETFNITHAHDLSGTMVLSNKPIGVFSGHTSDIKEQGEIHQYHHVLKMIPPINAWDKTYIVPPIGKRQKGIIRVLASQSSTVYVIKDGSAKTYDVTFSDQVEVILCARKVTIVQASSTVFVLQIIHTSVKSGHDWSAVTVPGVNEYLSEYHFVIPESSLKSSLIVIAERKVLEHIRVNGRNLSGVESGTVRLNRREFVIHVISNLRPGSYKLYNLNRTRRFGMIVNSIS